MRIWETKVDDNHVGAWADGPPVSVWLLAVPSGGRVLVQAHKPSQYSICPSQGSQAECECVCRGCPWCSM